MLLLGKGKGYGEGVESHWLPFLLPSNSMNLKLNSQESKGCASPILDLQGNLKTSSKGPNEYVNYYYISTYLTYFLMKWAAIAKIRWHDLWWNKFNSVATSTSTNYAYCKLLSFPFSSQILKSILKRSYSRN